MVNSEVGFSEGADFIAPIIDTVGKIPTGSAFGENAAQLGKDIKEGAAEVVGHISAAAGGGMDRAYSVSQSTALEDKVFKVISKGFKTIRGRIKLNPQEKA